MNGLADGRWLASYIHDVVLTELATYEECVTARMLHSFSRLDDEVDAKHGELLDSVPLGEGEDSSDADRWAGERASQWGFRIAQVFWASTAMFVVGLYHQFEQQAAGLAELACGGDRYGSEPGVQAGLKELVAVAEGYGVRLDDGDAWVRIWCELREVANVVKHAEGRAAGNLRRLRPDLFRRPSYQHQGYVPKAERPLTGEGIYVSEAEFTGYAALIREFWGWFAERLEHV